MTAKGLLVAGGEAGATVKVEGPADRASWLGSWSRRPVEPLLPAARGRPRSPLPPCCSELKAPEGRGWQLGREASLSLSTRRGAVPELELTVRLPWPSSHATWQARHVRELAPMREAAAVHVEGQRKS